MLEFFINMEVPSLANARMHWRAFSKLKIKQKLITNAHLSLHKAPKLGPFTVELTRRGHRKLDSDNLSSSMKYVRDQISAWIGVDDGSDLYTWKYAQETIPRKDATGIIVRIS